MSFLDDLPPLNRCGICVQVSLIIGIVFTIVCGNTSGFEGTLLLSLGVIISDGDNSAAHIQAPSVTIIFTSVALPINSNEIY